MTGQVGRPGTGLHPLRGQNNVQGASDAGLDPDGLPRLSAVEDATVRQFFEGLWGKRARSPERADGRRDRPCDPSRVDQGDVHHGREPGDVRPRRPARREAFAKLEHLVVQEIFLTETAYHADVILPASAFPEKTGTFTNTDRRVQMGRQALAAARARPGPTGRSSRRSRGGSGSTGTTAHPRNVFAEMRQAMPSLHGITWDRLEREGAVTYPCDSEDQPGHEIIFGDGFPTPTGRGKLVPADVLPPDEMPDDAYPMILTTGRLLEHWHTGAMTRRASVLDAIEPEAVAHLSPRDLKRLGVAPGSTVRVATRRGTIELPPVPTATFPRASSSSPSATPRPPRTSSPTPRSTRSARFPSSSSARRSWRRLGRESRTGREIRGIRPGWSSLRAQKPPR